MVLDRDFRPYQGRELRQLGEWGLGQLSDPRQQHHVSVPRQAPWFVQGLVAREVAVVGGGAKVVELLLIEVRDCHLEFHGVLNLACRRPHSNISQGLDLSAAGLQDRSDKKRRAYQGT